MKTFNITANCIPGKNYMVDTSNKLQQVMEMISRGEYFVINRPRQYGKTTTMLLLRKKLLSGKEYLPINMSFEGIGDDIFTSEKAFCPRFYEIINDCIQQSDSSYSGLPDEKKQEIVGFYTLSKVISDIVSTIGKKIVLFIDEVDKSSNNTVFLNFLGMLRNKYISARAELDVTFHSVILAGVHDIRIMKQKIRPEVVGTRLGASYSDNFNSPWNIAVPFVIDMAFNPAEIETMLADYVTETGIKMDTKAISEKIYFWTSGYPFLVSNMCKIVAEQILPKQEDKAWNIDIIDNVAKMMIREKNTLFEVIFKNLEIYPDLYKLLEELALGCEENDFVWQNPLFDQAYMYGFITANGSGKARIHNKIFQQVIINYFISKNETKLVIEKDYNTHAQYIKPNGKLDFEKILLSFQQVIKEEYSSKLLKKGEDFLEADLRLLFLVFLKPIINGYGHSFQEVEIGGEKRLDVVVTFRQEKFVAELKVWRGPQYHAEGKERLQQYMQTMSIEKGYMLIMTKTKKKTFKNEYEDGMLMVYV